MSFSFVVDVDKFSILFLHLVYSRLMKVILMFVLIEQEIKKTADLEKIIFPDVTAGIMS